MFIPSPSYLSSKSLPLLPASISYCLEAVTGRTHLRVTPKLQACHRLCDSDHQCHRTLYYQHTLSCNQATADSSTAKPSCRKYHNNTAQTLQRLRARSRSSIQRHHGVMALRALCLTPSHSHCLLATLLFLMHLLQRYSLQPTHDASSTARQKTLRRHCHFHARRHPLCCPPQQRFHRFTSLPSHTAHPHMSSTKHRSSTSKERKQTSTHYPWIVRVNLVSIPPAL